MKNASQGIVALEAKMRFNFNKLQAIACIGSSAAVSIGLIFWAIKSFG